MAHPLLYCWNVDIGDTLDAGVIWPVATLEFYSLAVTCSLAAGEKGIWMLRPADVLWQMASSCPPLERDTLFYRPSWRYFVRRPLSFWLCVTLSGISTLCGIWLNTFKSVWSLVFIQLCWQSNPCPRSDNCLVRPGKHRQGPWSRSYFCSLKGLLGPFHFRF